MMKKSTPTKPAATKKKPKLVFQCPLCPAQFSSKTYIKIHYSKEHGSIEDFDEKYVADNDAPGRFRCSPVSPEEQFKQVPPIIKIVVRFNCPECTKHFSSKLYCKMHYEKDHKGNVEVLDLIDLKAKYTAYECSKCPVKTYDLESYKTHITTHFKPSKKPRTYFLCEVCNIKFDSKTKIMEHNEENHDHIVHNKINNNNKSNDNEFRVKPGSYLIKFSTTQLKCGTYCVKNPEEIKDKPILEPQIEKTNEPILEPQIEKSNEPILEPHEEVIKPPPPIQLGPRLIKNPNCNLKISEPIRQPTDGGPRLIKNPNYNPTIPNYIPFNSRFKQIEFPQNIVPKPKRIRIRKEKSSKKSKNNIEIDDTSKKSNHYFMMINGKLTKFDGQAPIPEPRCKRKARKLPFKCQHCPESYNSYQYLKSHVDMIHNNTVQVDYRCGRCSQTFTNSPFLYEHLEVCSGIHALLDQTSTCSSDVSYANLNPSLPYQEDVDKALETITLEALIDSFV